MTPRRRPAPSIPRSVPVAKVRWIARGPPEGTTKPRRRFCSGDAAASCVVDPARWLAVEPWLRPWAGVNGRVG